MSTSATNPVNTNSMPENPNNLNQGHSSLNQNLAAKLASLLASQNQPQFSDSLSFPQPNYEQQSQGSLNPQNFTNLNNLPPIPESFNPQPNIQPQTFEQNSQLPTFQQPTFEPIPNQNQQAPVLQTPQNQIQPLIRNEIKTESAPEQTVAKNNIVPLQKTETEKPKNNTSPFTRLISMLRVNKAHHPVLSYGVGGMKTFQERLDGERAFEIGH